ncbi:hypothetical protein D3C87_1970580 [compost metagenome]
MKSIWAWMFPQFVIRNFARLDANGRCRAFKQCRELPRAAGWVEINEIRLQWLNQFLPASARVMQRHPRNRMQPSMTV